MTQPRLDRPEVLTPDHRLTWCALSAAIELADLLELSQAKPIIDAARTGNLIRTCRVISEMRKSRHFGTAVWRNELAVDYLGMVQQHIFSEVRAANAA